MMVGRDRTRVALAAFGCAILLTTVAGCGAGGVVMNRQHLDNGLVIILPFAVWYELDDQRLFEGDSLTALCAICCGAGAGTVGAYLLDRRGAM